MIMIQNKNEQAVIEDVINRLYTIGINKRFEDLNQLCISDESYSRFDDAHPYSIQDFNTASSLIQLRYAGISDYKFKIRNLKVDIYNDIALAIFYLSYMGVAVDGYSFRGQSVHAKSRVTLVLRKLQGSWRVIHEHLSKMPDESVQEDEADQKFS